MVNISLTAFVISLYQSTRPHNIFLGSTAADAAAAGRRGSCRLAAIDFGK